MHTFQCPINQCPHLFVLDVAWIAHSETSMFPDGLRAGQPTTHCSQCARVPKPLHKNGRGPPALQLHRQHHPKQPQSLMSLELCVVSLRTETGLSLAKETYMASMQPCAFMHTLTYIYIYMYTYLYIYIYIHWCVMHYYASSLLP
jgi:hypothetical protein